MTVTFVAGKSEDALEISQILEDWAEANYQVPLVHSVEEREDYGRWLLQNTVVTMVQSSGKNVGFLAVEKNTVQALYIKKNFQGMGFGKAAIRFAQTQFKELWLWVFQSNTGAQKFYQRLGFQIVEMTDGEDNDYYLPDIFYFWKAS